MKYKLVLLFLSASLFFSCSNDSGDAEPKAENIIGVWQAYELRINYDTASDDEKNAKDLLDYLTAKDCYVLTFNFKEDLNVVIDNSLAYLELTFSSDGLGFPCPAEKDTETTVYSYEEGVLSYVDDDGQTLTMEVSIDGDVMMVDAADLDVLEVEAGGQLVFKRM
ncbi:hypothetical protein EHW67_00285 [Arenibacter aquaticus]|uniref:Lipocalin-like domain-containing protein n=1 Tax=Arenibacter aquaticus TaxID=2489054 RepID=A0A430K7J7_9FLAO|nr:hypothetical protein [Arenibacter aquaticus]RTE55045.1 hypothetical protein EHW67_00285 [Arenibacter aquaticus]